MVKGWIVLLVILLISFTSASSLSPNIFNRWNMDITGNESKLYNINSLTNNMICIQPKDTTLKDIKVMEADITKPILEKGEITIFDTKEVIYKYPKDITLYSGKSKEIVITKDITDKELCFNLNPITGMLYRLGEQSIILLGNGVYSSTDTNVTQENLYTHLNLSDGSLVLYMPFDVIQDSANKTYDYSNNSNDGTLFGGTTTTQPVFNSTGGVYGGDYQFDGVNDYISVPVNFNVGVYDIFTVSFWVNTKKMGNPQEIMDFCKNSTNTLAINFNESGGLSAGVYNGASYTRVNSSNVLSTNTWYHVVYVHQSTTSSYLYVNNVLQTLTVNPKSGVSVGKYYIGAYSSLSASRWFNGSLDEIMIFNRELSAYEVGQLYNATYPRFYPNGEQRFIDNNFGTNNTVNITIPNCQQLNGSSIYFDINGNGFSQLNSTCMYDGYNLTGDTTNATVTLKLNSGTYSFYSPLVVGNITLNDYYVTYCTNNIVNQTIQDWYDITICFYDWKTQNKTIVEYDSNFCGDYGNVTYYLQQNTSCTNYWINYNPINGTKNCFAYNSKGRFAYNYLLNKITGNCTR